MTSPQKRRSQPVRAGSKNNRLGGRAQFTTPAEVSNTSTAAQRQRLLAHLRHDSLDTITARRDLNVMHPAIRVKELREEGHRIITVRVDRHDDQGRAHHNVALYTLLQGVA
ncbi:helix-turn-helix domain-containing protein [Rhodanobacter sp. Si-c]|uniref:Helix-turn-helix domain-containing protein n=1 Tax=Rhodanobacter lycopersici TaxID=3162487 RepID=A0ABV3Q9R7_9GAMM